MSTRDSQRMEDLTVEETRDRIGANRSLTVTAQNQRFRAARVSKRYTGHHISCALGLLLFARVAIAQTQALNTAIESHAQTVLPTSEKIAVGSPKISYVGGQLKIDALDSTLADVLTKVGALTGVNIDVPASANSERMHIVELGPGPARQILASLLSDSNFDYLIQASDTDPERIQSVLLMPREKRGSGTNETAARLSRSPYARAVAPPAISEERPVPDPPVPAQPENAAAEANSLNPQPVTAQTEESTPPPFAEPNRTMPQLPLSQPSTLAPPATLSPQSINQQLQQMYQQRVQMIQQGQTVPPPVRQ